MGVSIAIAAGKGGTGKTTFTANLGIALGTLGNRVAVVDADLAMANLELHFNLEGASTTLNDVLSGKAELKEAIYEKFGIAVIPAGIPLDKLRTANPERLRDVLEYLEENYDFLLIDSPAGLGIEAVTALATAQAVILVVNPEISSLVDALKTSKVARAYNTEILGAVVNRYSPEGVPIEDIAYILETKILGTLPEDPRVKAGMMKGMPIVISHRDSNFSMEILRIAQEISGDKRKIAEKESLVKKFLKRLGF